MKKIKTVNDFNCLYYHIREYIKNRVDEIYIFDNTFDYKEFISTYDICLKLILINHTYTK